MTRKTALTWAGNFAIVLAMTSAGLNIYSGNFMQAAGCVASSVAVMMARHSL